MSSACPSSILPTPIELEVEAVNPVALPLVLPVPPLPTAKVPVTPGLAFAEPSKLAVLVLPKSVLNSLAFVSVAADPVVSWFNVGTAAEVKPVT